jgi:ADP-ribose pyrophosphatase
MIPFKIKTEKIVANIGEKYSIIEANLTTPENKSVVWHYLKSKDVVVVLALTEDGQAYIKKEWRLNRKDFVWEVASGTVNLEHATETDLLFVANKELQEEMGVKANKLEKLTAFYLSNHTDCLIHLYLATQLQESPLPRDEHEFLEVAVLPFHEAFDLVISQQIPTAQNLLIFELAKQKLQLTA